MVVKGGDPVAYGFYRYASVYEPITRVKVYIRNPKKYAFLGKDVFTFIFDRRESSPSFRPFTPHDTNVPKYNYDRTKINTKSIRVSRWKYYIKFEKYKSNKS